MNTEPVSHNSDYRQSMGQLLMLYTQVDRLIMEVCAERLAQAPDEDAELSLAKQVGDESRHVSIQRQWMREFGTHPMPVIAPEQEQLIRAHFRSLPWIDFLADLYICVEALGTEAVERIVPLADPGTRESLRVPLTDEIDHVAFGISRLKQELANLSETERRMFLERLPARIESLADVFHGFGFSVRGMFEAVGADYDCLCWMLEERQKELIAELATVPQAISRQPVREMAGISS
ncbi:MAG: ferritin-like domain-containing protein [Gammaproteobacteria bacterium]|nr:ferritin-like domain-containing protein [Gammaproteobacteria bacterium]MBI5783507.1 ferritin-like domain-containing protein [Gammaproteobacteria bacterium]